MRALLIALLTASPAWAETPIPPVLQLLLDYHTTACKGRGGTLTIGATAITEVDLNGDGTPDHLLDSSAITCSTAPAMFCSDVGCELNVVVDNNQHSLVVLQWALEKAGNRSDLLITLSAILTGEAKDRTARLTWDDQVGALKLLETVE